MSGLFDELKRRNVVRVGLAYVVVSWVIMQIIDVIVEPLRLPDWTARPRLGDWWTRMQNRDSFITAFAYRPPD